MIRRARVGICARDSCLLPTALDAYENSGDRKGMDVCLFALCHISNDHKKKADHEEFALEALFEELSDEVDVFTGLEFPDYCLRWHADDDLMGRALRFGRVREISYPYSILNTTRSS